MLKIIAAMSANKIIGRNGDLPWKLPEDLKWFKLQTKGIAVVMGHETFKGIVRRIGRPLSDRENIVLTRQIEPIKAAVTTAHSWDEILGRSRNEDIFVIGGTEVYRFALPHADELWLTRVHAVEYGDAVFPEIEWKDWNLVFSLDRFRDERNNRDFTWEKYCRKVKHVEPANARSPAYRKELERIRDEDYCPFCLENLPRNHTKPILREFDHWVVTESMYPYPGTKVHLIAILRRHAELPENLSPFEMGELRDVLVWIREQFQVEGGGLLMRFGEPIRSGASVRHIHVQIGVPNIGAEPIKFFSGYSNIPQIPKADPS